MRIFVCIFVKDTDVSVLMKKETTRTFWRYHGQNDKLGKK